MDSERTSRSKNAEKSRKAVVAPYSRQKFFRRRAVIVDFGNGKRLHYAHGVLRGVVHRAAFARRTRYAESVFYKPAVVSQHIFRNAKRDVGGDIDRFVLVADDV